MEGQNHKLFGKVAYEAYKKAVGGKTWNGEDMKEFSEMPKDKQNAWHDAGFAVEQRIEKFDEMTMTIRKFTHETVIRLSEELALLDKAVEARKEDIIEENLKLLRLEKQIAEKQAKYEKLLKPLELSNQFRQGIITCEGKMINESDIDDGDERRYVHDGH